LGEPKNYRAIMLSSTFTDLKKHREQVIKAIREFGYKPEVMEDNGARADADVIDSSLQMVRDSVAYALIIGRKYGQTPICSARNPSRLSVTELEFNEAMRLKRPILLFIMDKKHPIIEEDIELDPDKRQKLDAFRERAKCMREGEEVQRVYDTFESLEQFSTAAAIAIGRLARDLGSNGSNAAEAPTQTHSNIPINVPRHFLGRGDDLAAVEAALKFKKGRAAITALHGLRGVGKTTLAAAYAEQHRGDYRATWWIRAETESTMRADLVGLGVRLGWVAADAAEEPAFVATLERLREEGEGILLVYDNAVSPHEIRKYLPRASTTRIIITSTAPNWRNIAEPVEIEVWSKEVGADYLIERTGRDDERDEALALSETLGGLPLAHEQAAAYCERLGNSLAEYAKKFESTPGKFLDDARAAPAHYHNGLTVAKTFALAIDEAAKLHPAAEPLIVYAALLAPEPIPLFLFAEAHGRFGEPLASAFADDGLDEAVAALRAFALIDRESIQDERDPSIITESIRLHRLVRQVAAARRTDGVLEGARRDLIAALVAVYPQTVFTDPQTWPRARRLDGLAMALVAGRSVLPDGVEKLAGFLLNQLAAFRQGPLAAYALVRPLLERALAFDEKVFGLDHLETATSLNNIGYMLRAQGDLAGARPYYERALAIREKALGSDHLETALSLNNLGALLRAQGDLAGARPYYERALAIREKALGSDHPDTALSLNNLGALLRAQGDPADALPYYDSALAIREKALGPDHPDTARSLNNLGTLLQEQGDLAGARPYFERALAIREKVLGPDHPDTARSLNNLGSLLQAQGDLAGARPYYERGLAIREKALGLDHPDMVTSLNNLGSLLKERGDLADARPYYERGLAIREKALGPDHPDTALSLNNLGTLLQAEGDPAGARPYFERALAISDKVLGAAHPTTKTVADNTASVLDALKCRKEAKTVRKKFGIKG
jgi:tetratricopeptide (TPR) repeat protein